MDSLNGGSECLSKRVEMLEKKMQDQENEIAFLKSGMSEALKRLSSLESGKPNLSSITCNQKQVPSRIGGSSVQTSKDQKPPTPKGLSGKQPFPTSPKSIADTKKWPSTEGPSNAIRGKPKEKETVEGCLKFQLRGRTLTFFAPTVLGSDFLANATNQIPKEKLSLEWVYGYRGKDARSNIYLLPTGEIVFFVAAVAVLYNSEEHTQRHYIGHTDDIRCLAIHPDKVTIATGQVAGHNRAEGKSQASKKADNHDNRMFLPHVRVWNSINLTTLKIVGLGDFERAVACISFSKQDGGLHMAVVDDSNEHVLSVWDWQKGEKGVKIAENKSSGDPVYFAEFHPCESSSLVLCGKGQISFWTLESCTLIKKQGIFEKHEKPKFVTCLAFNENGEVISGDSSGNICLWGKGTNRIHQEILGAHEGGLFSICMLKDGSFLSGGKDRKIVKWEYSEEGYKKSSQELELPESCGPARQICKGEGDTIIVGTIKNNILRGSFDQDFTYMIQGHMDELWGLAEHPTQKQFLTCGYDKNVYMWDSLTHTVVWSKEMPEGCHAVAIHPDGLVAIVTGISSRFYVLDLSTHEVMSSHSDASERIECVQFSPNGLSLACGSRDNFIYVYTVSEGHKLSKAAKLSGHSSFILHIDWSMDGSYLQSNSGDYELLFWNMSTYKQVLSPSSLRDVDWATNTCTLSFNACGIWPEGADGTDVNACSRSHARSLLAAADDFGKVALFSYPSFVPKSHSLAYQGHSSHVTNVKFLHDDTRLLSIGGKDTSVMQWQVISLADEL